MLDGAEDGGIFFGEAFAEDVAAKLELLLKTVVFLHECSR